MPHRAVKLVGDEREQYLARLDAALETLATMLERDSSLASYERVREYGELNGWDFEL